MPKEVYDPAATKAESWHESKTNRRLIIDEQWFAEKWKQYKDLLTKQFPVEGDSVSLHEILSQITKHSEYNFTTRTLVQKPWPSLIPQWLWWVVNAVHNPDTSDVMKVLKEVHKTMFADIGVNDHKFPWTEWFFWMLYNLNSAFKIRSFGENGSRKWTIQIRRVYKNVSPELPAENTKPVTASSIDKRKVPEKKEVVNVSEKWYHNEALISTPSLAPEKVANLQSAFASSKNISCMINASVDHRPVAERSWAKVDALYSEAESYMKKTIRWVPVFEKQWNALIVKSGALKELKSGGGAEYNRKLLIARGAAGVRELYVNVMTPYLQKRVKAENRNDARTLQERDRLINSIQIGDMFVGAKTKNTVTMSQNRYTSFSA